MGKKIVTVYLESEVVEKAQVKAATELKIFKFSNLVNQLLKDFVEES